MAPEVADDYTITFGGPMWTASSAFLCDDRQFSRRRVMDALARARNER
jgi:hypothetical protein